MGLKYLRPEDSNAAVEVCDRATRKAPEEYDRQTDKQTSKLSAHSSKIFCTSVFAFLSSATDLIIRMHYFLMQ